MREIGMATFACLLVGSQGWLVGHAPSSRPAASTAATSSVRTASLRMDEEGIQRPEAFVGSSFGSSAMSFRQGTLVLEDGTRLRGVSFGFEDSIAGVLKMSSPPPPHPEARPNERGRGLTVRCSCGR